MKMKTGLTYKLGMVFLFALAALTLSGQSFEKSKTIIKSFAVNPQTEVSVKNKYGKIQILHWDKDSVKIIIDVVVSAKKESKVESVFDKIDFEFVDTRHWVKATTLFEGEGSLWTDLKDKTNALIVNDHKAQIDFQVYVPSEMSLQLENKYGDIYLPEQKGSIDIKLSNGELNGSFFYGETTFDLNFAYATVDFIKTGQLTLSYHSELQIEEAENLEIESQSSRIDIGRIANLKLDSRRDKIVIEDLTTLDAITSFSHLKVKELSGSLILDARYGSFTLREFRPEVKKIKLNTESTKVSISKTTQQSIFIELIYDKKAELYFSDALNQKVSQKEDEEKEWVKTIGILGPESAISRTTIEAKVISGSFKIETKIE